MSLKTEAAIVHVSFPNSPTRGQKRTAPSSALIKHLFESEKAAYYLTEKVHKGEKAGLREETCTVTKKTSQITNSLQIYNLTMEGQHAHLLLSAPRGQQGNAVFCQHISHSCVSRRACGLRPSSTTLSASPPVWRRSSGRQIVPPGL